MILLRCTSSLNSIKKKSHLLARSRAGSWFSAWHWRAHSVCRHGGAAVAEQALAEAVLERAEAGAPEAAEQLIARITKPILRPAFRAWFGTPRIEGA